MKKAFSILLFCLPVMLFSQAQFYMKGKVVDTDSKQAIQGAKLSISTGTGQILLATVTNDTGYFMLEVEMKIVEGDYPIVINKEGYYPVNGYIRLKNNAYREFRMKRMLDEVVNEDTIKVKIAKVDTPKITPVPKIDTPKVVVVPKIDTPKVAPKIDTPKVVIIPKIDTPKVIIPPQIEEPVFVQPEIPEITKNTQIKVDTAAQTEFVMPLVVGFVTQINNIFFATNAYVVKPASYAELNKIVGFLKENQNIKVEIGGHTNGNCDDVFCNTLSTNRAKSVVDYFVSKGIPAARLSYKGYGKTQPLAKDAQGKASMSVMNQRVEIKIISLE